MSIHAPLQRLLAGCAGTGRICPPQWQRHWRELRQHAGFTHWVPDVLRHTCASYHLRHFRSYSELQYEIGHRDSSLLRTRYENMSRLSDAAGEGAGREQGLCLVHVVPEVQMLCQRMVDYPAHAGGE